MTTASAPVPPDPCAARPEYLVGETRDPAYRRVAHGVFALVRPGLDAEQEFTRDLHALRHVLPDDAVFTHLTGARILGWNTPPLPEAVPIFVATRQTHHVTRRPGVICSRLTHAAPPFRRTPLPVDQPEEILLRAARDLGAADLAILISSARRLGHLCPRRMARLLESRRPGVARLRAGLDLADATARDADRALLAAFHRVLQLKTRRDVVVRDRRRRPITRVELLVGRRVVHEWEQPPSPGRPERPPGSRHLRVIGADPEQTHWPGSEPPSERHRALAAAGYRRRGFTRADLVDHHPTTIAEVYRSLGLAQRADLAARWARIVDHSLYSPEGRLRLMNRWRRQMGVQEWA